MKGYLCKWCSDNIKPYTYIESEYGGHRYCSERCKSLHQDRENTKRVSRPAEPPKPTYSADKTTANTYAIWKKYKDQGITFSDAVLINAGNKRANDKLLKIKANERVSNESQELPLLINVMLMPFKIISLIFKRYL